MAERLNLAPATAEETLPAGAYWELVLAPNSNDPATVENYQMARPSILTESTAYHTVVWDSENPSAVLVRPPRGFYSLSCSNALLPCESEFEEYVGALQPGEEWLGLANMSLVEFASGAINGTAGGCAERATVVAATPILAEFGRIGRCGGGDGGTSSSHSVEIWIRPGFSLDEMGQDQTLILAGRLGVFYLAIAPRNNGAIKLRFAHANLTRQDSSFFDLKNDAWTHVAVAFSDNIITPSSAHTTTGPSRGTKCGVVFYVNGRVLSRHNELTFFRSTNLPPEQSLSSALHIGGIRLQHEFHVGTMLYPDAEIYPGLPNNFRFAEVRSHSPAAPPSQLGFFTTTPHYEDQPTCGVFIMGFVFLPHLSEIRTQIFLPHLRKFARFSPPSP